MVAETGRERSSAEQRIAVEMNIAMQRRHADECKVTFEKAAREYLRRPALSKRLIAGVHEHDLRSSFAGFEFPNASVNL